MRKVSLYISKQSYIYIYIYIYIMCAAWVYVCIGVADHADVLGAKYANMLLLLKNVDLSVGKENNIVLSPII